MANMSPNSNGLRPRKKGETNKYTKLRQEFLKTFERIGGGKHMERWALKHPTEFYKILKSLLPKQFEIDSPSIGELAHVLQSMEQSATSLSNSQAIKVPCVEVIDPAASLPAADQDDDDQRPTFLDPEIVDDDDPEDLA